MISEIFFKEKLEVISFQKRAGLLVKDIFFVCLRTDIFVLFVAVRVFTTIQENAPKSGRLASQFVFIMSSVVVIIVNEC